MVYRDVREEQKRKTQNSLNKQHSDGRRGNTTISS